MTVFTYSQARQNFARLLELAGQEGEVLVKRQDGSLFSIKPERRKKSPLNVSSIKTSIKTPEIVQIIRETRSKNSR